MNMKKRIVDMSCEEITKLWGELAEFWRDRTLERVEEELPIYETLSQKQVVERSNTYEPEIKVNPMSGKIEGRR